MPQHYTEHPDLINARIAKENAQTLKAQVDAEKTAAQIEEIKAKTKNLEQTTIDQGVRTQIDKTTFVDQFLAPHQDYLKKNPPSVAPEKKPSIKEGLEHLTSNTKEQNIKQFYNKNKFLRDNLTPKQPTTGTQPVETPPVETPPIEQSKTETQPTEQLPKFGMSPTESFAEQNVEIPSSSFNQSKEYSDKFFESIKGLENTIKEQSKNTKRFGAKFENAWNKAREDRRQITNMMFEQQRQAQEASKKTKEYMQNIYSLKEQLRQPNYRRAVVDIPMFSKISSIIHAGIQGYLGRENPSSMLKNLIQMNYQDQVAEYNSQMHLLDKQESLYSKIREFEKEEYKAQMAFYSVMYEHINNEANTAIKEFTMQSQMNNQQTQLMRQLAELSKESASFMFQIENNEFNKQLNMQKIIIDSDKMSMESAIKRETLKGKVFDNIKKEQNIRLGGSPTEIQKLQMDKKEMVDKKTIGNIKDKQNNKMYPFVVYNPSQTKEIKKTFDDSEKVMNLGKEVLNITDELGEEKGRLAALKTKVAYEVGKFPLLKKTETFKKVKKLETNLVNMALNMRIEISGGGNMSDQEGKILFGLFFLDRKDKLMINKDFMKNILRGDFKTVLNVFKRLEINKSWKEYDQSIDKSLLSNDQIIQTKEDFARIKFDIDKNEFNKIMQLKGKVLTKDEILSMGRNASKGQ